MRPASITVTTRLTRSRAISGCQVTSTKCAPNEWLENFGFVATPNVAWELPRPDTARRLPILKNRAYGTPLEVDSPWACTRPFVYSSSEPSRPANFEPGALAAVA